MYSNIDKCHVKDKDALFISLGSFDQNDVT